MALESSLRDWLKFILTPGLGSEGQRKLLQVFGSPTAVLQQPHSTLNQYVRQPVARAIAEGVDEAVLASTANWLEDPLNRILTVADADYPQALLNIPDPPLLLYIKGRLDLLNTASLAIVGSRNATTQGLRNAEAFAKSASASGLSVVSGLAQGIDAGAQMLRGIGERLLDQLLVGAPLLRKFLQHDVHFFQHLGQHLAAQRILLGLQGIECVARGAQLFRHRRTQPLRLRRLRGDHAIALLVQTISQVGEHGAVLLLQHLHSARGLPQLQDQHGGQQQQHKDQEYGFQHDGKAAMDGAKYK
jgi:hypothetical protein